MKTNKPEVRFTDRSWPKETGIGAERAVVRLSDYEALQAECERWKNAAHGAHRQLTANRLETEKLAVDWSKAMAECEKLRSLIHDIKEWDCDVDGGFLSIPLDLRRRIQKAIDAAMQEGHQ